MGKALIASFEMAKEENLFKIHRVKPRVYLSAFVIQI